MGEIIHPRNMRAYIEARRKYGIHDRRALFRFIEACWGIHIPQAQVCPDHTPPGDYLAAAFFEELADCICWANRSGGKTFLGALATWLDSVFKDRCETKILGGSREQSERMYGHLTGEGGVGLVTEDFEYLIKGEVLSSKTSLVNKAHIQILTASTRSVRGPHPQKLKLDEVDEVEGKIYNAALLIPKSKYGIQASTHIYSTMHKSFGLMQKIIEGAALGGYRVFKWCIFEVLEKCQGRECGEVCPLWEDCGGRAKKADGYYPIHDAITMKRKVPPAVWDCEMLCKIPSQEDLIYPEFDPSIHII